MKDRKKVTFPKLGSALINVLTKFFIFLIALMDLSGLKTRKVRKDFKLAFTGKKSMNLSFPH